MNTHRNRQPEIGSRRGFTLVELLVTIVIATILVGLAASSYLNQARAARRAEAKTAILDLAGREERNYSTTNTYASTPGPLGYTGGAFPLTVGSGYYSLNVVVVPAAVGPPATPATYTITALPLVDQLKDLACGQFTYTQAGAQAAKTSGGVDNTVLCWQH